MRLASVFTALLVLGACATPAPSSTPADWSALADALGSEEYAETFLDELETRLDAADADLAPDQRTALYRVLYDGAERNRALIARYRDAGPAQQPEAERALLAERTRTDTEAEALLRPTQVPVYRALQRDVRAALAREAARG